MRYCVVFGSVFCWNVALVVLFVNIDEQLECVAIFDFIRREPELAANEVHTIIYYNRALSRALIHQRSVQRELDAIRWWQVHARKRLRVANESIMGHIAFYRHMMDSMIIRLFVRAGIANDTKEV